jgi:hypothetical protein
MGDVVFDIVTKKSTYILILILVLIARALRP